MSTIGNVINFIGCDTKYKESDLVIFGAPFDSTASNRTGSRLAPNAIRLESANIEIYSPYQDKSLDEIKVSDVGDLVLPFGDVKKSLDEISKMTAKILKDEKIPFMIGGEHLVTYGAFKEVVKKYPDVKMLHFDAHTDLRDEFFSCKLSHATVIRRCYDLIGDKKIFQFGIRSGVKAEFDFAKEHQYLEKFKADTFEKMISDFGKTPVYLTIDLDVLDPALMRGTGTPEAGGISFYRIIEIIKAVRDLNIIGLDIVELAPNYDQSNVSTATSALIVRELLLSILGK